MSSTFGKLFVKYLYEALAWVTAYLVVGVAVKLVKRSFKSVRKSIAARRKTELAPAE